MSIRSSSIVFALACVTLGAVVYSQSAGYIPRIGTIPETVAMASYDTLADADIQGMDRRVTAKFENATIDQVLKWLSGEKLSFVADTSAYKGTTLTLNFENATLGDVLDSISKTLGAHWERSGDVFTLRSGTHTPRAKTTVAEAPAKSQSPKVDVQAKKADGEHRFRFEMGNGDAKAFVWEPKSKSYRQLDEKEMQDHLFRLRDSWTDGRDFKIWTSPERFQGLEKGKAYRLDPKTGKPVPLSDKERQELEKKWKAWGEEFGKNWEQWGEQFGKHWEKWSKEFEKAHKEGKAMPPMPPMPPMSFEKMKLEMPDMKGYIFVPDGQNYPMSDADKKAFEQAMKELRESLPKGMDGQKLSEEHRKAFEEAHRHLKEMRIDLSKELDAKAFKELHELKAKDLPLLREKIKLEALPKIGEVPMVGRPITSGTIKELMASLTEDQKKLHKEQGHLKWSQLTEKQRRALGMKLGGQFTISFTIDGVSLTIKND